MSGGTMERVLIIAGLIVVGLAIVLPVTGAILDLIDRRTDYRTSKDLVWDHDLHIVAPGWRSGLWRPACCPVGEDDLDTPLRGRYDWDAVEQGDVWVVV